MTTVPTAGDEERLVERATYMVGNPSAWDVYDEGASDVIRDLLAAHARLRQERDDALALAERLKLEAQCHASEARAANSTIYEIYQVISGSKGEPGNWNGAEPVRQFVSASNAEAEQLREALRQARRTMRNCAGAIQSGQIVDKEVDRNLRRGYEAIDAALQGSAKQ